MSVEAVTEVIHEYMYEKLHGKMQKHLNGRDATKDPLNWITGTNERHGPLF